MPIFTSLLFFFLALALLPLAFRGSRVRQSQRELSALEERMALGASICIAAARQAFRVDLDQSIESLGVLDSLITSGWSSIPRSESLNVSDAGSDSKEVTFVLAGYLGTAFVQNRAAIWRVENGKPALYFRSVKESEYPLELIELKLKEPAQVSLVHETERWGLPPEPLASNGNEPAAE